MTNSEHWSRNPLHIVESPLNFSGKARRGLTGGGGWFGMFTGISSWVAAGAGGDKLSPCRDRTNSSVSAVKRVSWCWWMASWLAWAESSDVSCVKAAGGAGTTVFYGEWCECVYWWQVQTISPRYVGGESNELVIRRGLPLVVWERRCKGLVCNTFNTE